jgi:hypothetical protein
VDPQPVLTDLRQYNIPISSHHEVSRQTGPEMAAYKPAVTKYGSVALGQSWGGVHSRSGVCRSGVHQNVRGCTFDRVSTAAIDPVHVRGLCGDEWWVTPHSLDSGSGCASCAERGYNPGKPGYVYLMERPGEQQIGITIVPEQRLRTHRGEGWELVELVGPMDGRVALDREAAMKQFIKTLDAVPSTRENWHTHSYEASSIAEVEAAALAS